MDQKYAGNSFTLVQRENNGHSTQIYILGGLRGLDHEAEILRKRGLVVFDYKGINQDAIQLIDDACRRANRGEQDIDFIGLLE